MLQQFYSFKKRLGVAGWKRSTATLIALLSVTTPASADICLQSAIEVSVVNKPSGLGSASENLLFDGLSTYIGDTQLEFEEPSLPGEEALILNLGMTLLQDTTFELFYEVDHADGKNAQQFVDALSVHGYGSWYWDHNNDGILDGSDFDLGGDGDVDLGTGDYSPLGIIVQLYNGDPGNPVGTGPGVLVHTAHSPIQQIQSVAYSFTVTSPAEFDHLVVESTPDGAAEDPRIIEIRHNGNANFKQGSTYGSSLNCGQTVDKYL